ncbi:hypothetical protein [Nostoc cycadae]|uniref:CTP synthetase n=1 Tax=Nostoc cycadae WK-1 TaxID=1861711 RepID=A0A2H6LC73_9NOSO|nr:hypothetical protein [Nostoc cycadae]GBE90835.1 CTP synthetase [Nostoc cycadae WK-1]
MVNRSRPSQKLTEEARQELSLHLAANPTPNNSAFAFASWLLWCVRWSELSKEQAKAVLTEAIQQLTEVRDTLC